MPEITKPKAWIVDEHIGWGDSITYLGKTTDGQFHRWTGHTTPHPSVGDHFIAEMVGGLKGAFKVIEVKPAPLNDPPDQWFAKTLRTAEQVFDD